MPFSEPITWITEALITEASFGFQKLDRQCILGIDGLRRLDVIVDLPSQRTVKGQGEGGVIIPSLH